MAVHKYKVLVDNCVLAEKGKTADVDDERYNVAALVSGGVLEPAGKAAKEAVED